MTTDDWRARPDGSPAPAMLACLRAAAAAPSIHNTQPWLFRVSGDVIEVRLDDTRQLRVADPDGRAMHLSVGAALLNLRMAILARGREPSTQLLPDPASPDLAARVTVGPARPVDPDARELAAAIRKRRTNRHPFAGRPVPEPILAECVAAALSEGAMLVVVDPTARYDVLALTRTAEERWRNDPASLDETGAWTATWPSRRDGIPAPAWGPLPIPSTYPARRFGILTGRRTARFETSPTIAVLYSRGDRAVDWLRAGIALERVLLTATARGVGTSLLTQATEVPALRAEFVAHDEPHWAQAVIRLGYARRAARTPRRPLADLLHPAG